MNTTKLMIEAARRRWDELDSGRVAEADRGEFANQEEVVRFFAEHGE
jgi:predicted transcriptional regulator